MPKYVKINDLPVNSLCLVYDEVKSSKPVVKREAVNHIWIYDRSGSMTGALPELTKQLIFLSKRLPLGDTLTLGWFSSEGDFNFIFKGFKVTEGSDYDALERAIKANSNSRGCTCFSEILTSTEQVIADLSVFSKVFSLHFFTDGYPVVSNYKREIENIFTAIKAIRGKLQTAMLVGYGYYYNKELMTQMAEKLGALLIHSSLIPEYADSVGKLVKLSSSQEMKEEVTPVVGNPLAVFTITSQGVALQSIDENGKLYIAPESGKSTPLYYIFEGQPKPEWEHITKVDFQSGGDVMASGIYAAALVLTQQVRTDLALEFVGRAGDIKVVNALFNAFTIEEYGQAEQVINEGLTVEGRFREGRDTRYLPAADAFCVFDLLNVLIADNAAFFYPYNDKFDYEKIGVGTVVDDGYPKFNPKPDVRCSFNNLVWHQSRLNLSIQTRVEGTVTLKEVEGTKPAAMGFADVYPTFVYRNFTFIKDGRVHIKRFYISTSEDTYYLLKNKGIVVDDEFKVKGIYGLDITKLPAINRAIANGKTSATALCKQALAEQKLKGYIKALKYAKDQEFGDKTSKVVGFTEAQVAFLLANGIDATKDNIYSPPTKQDAGHDKYMAKTFDIKIAGLMSLPTVAKVMEKMNANKKRTPVEELVEAGVSAYSKLSAAGMSETVKLAWLEDEIAKKQKEMRDIRKDIQTAKFAVLLGKKWFDEFATRDQTELAVDGNTFKFELGEEEVEI